VEWSEVNSRRDEFGTQIAAYSDADAERCTNGCTCNRDLTQLAHDLKRELNADELRELVGLLGS